MPTAQLSEREVRLPGPLFALSEGTELLTGFAEALAVRSTIQLALGMIMNRAGITNDDVCLNLRLQAVESGTSLLAAAGAIVRGGL